MGLSVYLKQKSRCLNGQQFRPVQGQGKLRATATSRGEPKSREKVGGQEGRAQRMKRRRKHPCCIFLPMFSIRLTEGTDRACLDRSIRCSEIMPTALPERPASDPIHHVHTLPALTYLHTCTHTLIYSHTHTHLHLHSLTHHLHTYWHLHTYTYTHTPLSHICTQTHPHINKHNS